MMFRKRTQADSEGDSEAITTVVPEYSEPMTGSSETTTVDSEPDSEPDSESIPPWARVSAYILTVIVAGAALAASAHGLYTLGRIALYPEWVSIVLFIGLDAGAAGAGVLWVAGPPGSTVRSIGRRCGKTLIAASALCNGLSALAIPQRAYLAVWAIAAIAVLIGVLFPVIAGAMIHMTLLVKDSRTGERHTEQSGSVSLRDLGRAVIGQAIARVGTPSTKPLSAQVLSRIERDAQRAARHSQTGVEQPGVVPESGQESPGAIGATLAPDDGRPALERARDWCREQFAAGRVVTATAANRAVGTNGYVKRDVHVEPWRAEWEAEQHETSSSAG